MVLQSCPQQLCWQLPLYPCGSEPYSDTLRTRFTCSDTLWTGFSCSDALRTSLRRAPAFQQGTISFTKCSPSNQNLLHHQPHSHLPSEHSRLDPLKHQRRVYSGKNPLSDKSRQTQVRCSISSGVSPPQFSAPIISVVIPVLNEVESIGLLLERVASVLQRRGYAYEILCVDDGSTDGTTRLLKTLAVQRKDLRALILRRNFGQTAALSAGFDAAVGDVIVTLDGDLQNDPDDIPKLVDHLLYGGSTIADGRARGSGTVREDGGFDMVCGWRRERQDDIIRRVPSQVANWLIGKVTGIRLHDCGCSLKAFRADLLSSFRLYGETHRLIPAIAAIEGAAIAELPVRHHPRSFGSSKYPPLGRTPRVILDLLLVAFLDRYRDRPMQLFGFVGGLLILTAIGCAVNGVYSILAVARHWGVAMAWPAAVPTLVLALELGVAGIQMVFLGFLADICIRTYFESQNRAQYNVREIVTSTSGVR